MTASVTLEWNDDAPRRRYHICIGTPPGHLEDLREDSVAGETIWTINSEARAGDHVLFYMTMPVGALVARGVVLRDARRETDPESPWRNYFMADIGSLEMFDRPITRATIMGRIPAWKYWSQPQRSSRVKEQFVLPLESLLRAAYV
jgi:EVE domain